MLNDACYLVRGIGLKSRTGYQMFQLTFRWVSFVFTGEFTNRLQPPPHYSRHIQISIIYVTETAFLNKKDSITVHDGSR